jgi:hypothetical protein
MGISMTKRFDLTDKADSGIQQWSYTQRELSRGIRKQQRAVAMAHFACASCKTLNGFKFRMRTLHKLRRFNTRWL